MKSRYPGANSFQEDDSPLFFGRDKDIRTLSSRILSNTITVLHSKSGLGKTSLLQAGVLPRITKQKDFLIIKIRLGAADSSGSLPPLQTLQQAIPKESTWADEMLDDSLWSSIKKLELMGKHKIIVVIDQFEELFSYQEQDIIHFKNGIAEMISENIPIRLQEPINAALDADEENEDENEDLELLFMPADIKIVFAIRSDKFSLLGRIADKIPTLLRNQYELQALDKKGAKDAILKPANAEGDFYSAPFVYTEDAVSKILKYLTDSDTQPIESTQLQILCDKIEKLQLKEVKVEDIPDFEDIFSDFYYDTLELIEESERLAVKRFVENELVKKGQRISLDRNVCEEFVTDKHLSILVNAHLVREERNNLGGTNYELAHDTLLSPIIKSKEIQKAEDDRRAQAQKLKEAEALAEKERAELAKAQKQVRTVRRALIFAVVMLVLAFAGLGYALIKEKEARLANKDAKEQRDFAKSKEKEALEALAKFQEEQAAKEKFTFDALKKRASTIIDAGGCPDDLLREMKEITENHPEKKQLEKETYELKTRSKCP
ncbi:MAG: hypothetical protein JJT94_14775 [Bernardetiaceae bacterium]|nr:hypothetical protein [Bernardetiaceae bacterium]